METKYGHNFTVTQFVQRVVFFVVAVGGLSELYSAGTPAGTVIQSRSRVTFTSKSGAQIDTAYSAFVSITVAQKGSFNITPSSNAVTTNKDSTNADYPVTITNSGNGIDIGKLSSISSKGWLTKIYSDINGDGALQSGEINTGTISQTSSIGIDAQFNAIVRVVVPRGEALNGIKDTTIAIVKSNFDSSISSSGSYVTTVSSSGIDPIHPGVIVDNPNPAAGQNVTYSFSFTNNGSVSASGLTITDLLGASFTFISATTTVGSVNSSGNPISWNIGTVNPGTTVTVTITLQVNPSVSPNTILGNQFILNYNVSGNSYTLGSNTGTVTVTGISSYGVEITSLFDATTKEPLDTAWYRFKVRNTGSFKDVIELSYTSSLALGWKLYKDGNNNGIWDLNDPLLTNTNSKAGVDVDSIAIGDSVRVFAMAPITRFATDNIKDSMQVVATSSGDVTKTDNKWAVTTLHVENITLEKSVFPLGNQPAGTEMSYTIRYSNTGSVAVSNFSVTDTSPKETNYISNSVKVNGTSVADNSVGVSISKDVNNNTVIAVSIGTLGVNTNGTIEFKLKIK